MADDRATRRDRPAGTVRDGSRGTMRDRAGTGREYGIVLPDHLDRDYHVVDDLSRGGEATVAVIQHRDTGHLKVVKIYRQGITLPRAFIDKMRTARSEHVLPVERSVFTGWAIPRFIEVMDLVPGGSLEDLLEKSRGGLPDQARQILEQLTDALAYIHDDLKVVHRDIKPANVLVRSRGPLDLVLADLGIASELDEIARSRRETTGSVKGTPVYQSPETLTSSDSGRARDWWALGMTMCEVLTGRHPFKDSAGNPLSDNGRISRAIIMGEFDLSSITDPRWNLLCRGLLTHHPEDRWGARQVRAWLAGETPAVMSRRPSVSETSRSVANFRFAGRAFTDPVELSSHMVKHWAQATDVFIDKSECDALRAWIREDLQDNSIATNLLTPVGGHSALADARIIAFTSHYRGPGDVRLRGYRVTASELALRLLKAGSGWKDDDLLKLLHPKVIDALVESQLDPAADQRGQSSEYGALAQFSRYTADVDREIDAAARAVTQATSAHVSGVDVGADVRSAMPRRVERAQAVARAALLSRASLQEIWSEFGKLDKKRPAWFSDLCAKVGDPLSTRNVDTAGSIARLALVVGIADLAQHLEAGRKRAVAEAKERSDAAAAAAEAARQAAVRTERRRVAGMAAIGAAVCLVGLIAHVWLVDQFQPDPRDWMNDTAYHLVNWPTAQIQELALGFGMAALGVLAVTALNSTVDIGALRQGAIALSVFGGICILPMLIIALGMILLVVFTLAVLVMIVIGLASAAGG